METKRQVLLIILDGWGIGKGNGSNAIYNAPTPNMDDLKKNYANSKLSASGEDVGLPAGQMGNSEVGHLNLGSGRIVYQDFGKINRAIEDRSLQENEVLKDALNKAKGKALHLMGLVSDGGVHSHINHLKALIDIAQEAGLEKVYVHAFMDGRDTDPYSGKGYLEDLQGYLQDKNAELVSVVGRYYAMDRDKRWERIKEAYDLLLTGKGKTATDLIGAVDESYAEEVTDEFIKPIVKVEADQPVGRISEGDVVISFNFRTDRMRQLSIALTQEDLSDHGMKVIPLNYYTMTRYDGSFEHIGILFDKENIENTLGELVAKNGLNQLRIAETEKYAHVTFFFSGGREEPFDNEDRIMIPSPKVATYDLKPEMSAFEVKDVLIKDLQTRKHDFICLNFANTDMVGHTGDFQATVKAATAVDKCVGALVEEAQKQGYTLVITADHGNAEYEKNEDGSPNTAHTSNPVPFILVTEENWQLKDGRLSDVAPTICQLLELKKPEEMTGESLLSENGV